MKTVTAIRNILGECPVWSPVEQKLYWLDLLAPALYAYTPTTETVEQWSMPEYLGGLALRQRGGLILGMQSRIAGFYPANGMLEDLAPLENMGDGMRCNDGKCDCHGRFFIGTMLDPSIAQDPEAEQKKKGAGTIVMLDADLQLHSVETGFTTPNGFVWNQDYSTLYMADSDQKTIFAYDYACDTAHLTRKRPFVVVEDKAGIPDGACLDREGCLWSARYGGGCIVRYSPQGEELIRIELPVTQPTSLAFGGPDLGTLYATTASQGLTPEELARYPLSGMLFAMNVGVRGTIVNAFSG